MSPSISRAGKSAPGVTGCFSVASSRLAACRISATASSFRPSARAIQAVTAMRWISLCSAQ